MATQPISGTLGRRPNALARTWAQSHAAELVVDITAASREKLRSTISKALLQNVPYTTLARNLKSLIGLEDSQVDAVWNLRKRILTSPGKLIYAGRTPIRVPKALTRDFVERAAH